MMQSKVIGLTGGISTGKSTVSRILKSKGYRVIDADVIAREVLDIGTDEYREVVDFFGEGILKSDLTIDRKALSKVIFNDNRLREKLNSITHPNILIKIKEEIDKHKDENILFLDIPLLLEIKDDLVKYGIVVDQIWLVYIDRETQINRLIKRDKIDRELAELKIGAQMDIEEKRKLVDKIIDNSGDETNLIENIEAILK